MFNWMRGCGIIKLSQIDWTGYYVDYYQFIAPNRFNSTAHRWGWQWQAASGRPNNKLPPDGTQIFPAIALSAIFIDDLFAHQLYRRDVLSSRDNNNCIKLICHHVNEPKPCVLYDPFALTDMEAWRAVWRAMDWWWGWVVVSLLISFQLTDSREMGQGW